ncbi:hypothetical protein DPMN_193539 [Dreissena polymorpha]|uniref:Uncharacterized protein n=1 Tax=Dreissena polymorpha TaxID=45954 RepID=A0A9D3Y131_DREPO|nr:hypothetical protein DPMN_193539 [Dreissena polymorpha]
MTAVLSSLNVLVKPFWGSGRRLVASREAIKAAHAARSGKRSLEIVNTPLAE